MRPPLLLLSVFELDLYQQPELRSQCQTIIIIIVNDVDVSQSVAM